MRQMEGTASTAMSTIRNFTYIYVQPYGNEPSNAVSFEFLLYLYFCKRLKYIAFLDIVVVDDRDTAIEVA